MVEHVQRSAGRDLEMESDAGSGVPNRDLYPLALWIPEQLDLVAPA
jgi:hypothetical protein